MRIELFWTRLSSNFVHQMCHQDGGEGGGVPIFSKTLAGYISSSIYVIASYFLQNVGHT